MPVLPHKVLMETKMGLFKKKKDKMTFDEIIAKEDGSVLPYEKSDEEPDINIEEVLEAPAKPAKKITGTESEKMKSSPVQGARQRFR